MGPAVLFVSLVTVLGLVMILPSGPLAMGARRMHPFLRDENAG
jgi:hypothetical protein